MKGFLFFAIMMFILGKFIEIFEELNNSVAVDIQPVAEKVEVKIVPTVEEITQQDLEWYRSERYAECYGNMTLAHKKTGLHDRNRSASIKVKEQVCTAAVTNPEITAWNSVYTEVK